MHVLLLPSWYPETPSSLDGIFFRQQAHALQRAGLRVSVVAPLFRSPRRLREIFSGRYGTECFSDGPIPTYTRHSVYFFPRIPYLDRERWVAAGMRLFERYLAEQGRPDILHAHAVNHGGILAYRISRRHGIPYVITEHSSTYARGLIRSWQRAAMRAAADGAAARFAVSPDFCRLLALEYGGSEWRYLPNILGASFCEPLPERGFQTVSNGFTFCSVAHLNRNKGFDVLLDAFARALEKRPDLRLKIGGGGVEEAALKRQAGRLKIDAAVDFLGALDNGAVFRLMRGSDAFVLASRNETFGVVFIEALSQGLPVAATRCGGPQTIINENNGILVPVGDVQALAGALVSLYENRGRYDAQTLRADCLNEFGEEAVVRQITAVYKTILGGTHES